MTPEERDLITGLFHRLKAAETGQKDREADDLINRLVVQQPSAPYLLTQLALVQEHALNNAQARIAQLESELAAAKRAEPGEDAGSKPSFLGGLLGRGPWGPREAAPQPAAAAPTSAPAAPRYASAPPSYASAPQGGGGSVPSTAPSAGGGFLHQALSTAAGVAGGALLYDGIRSLFWHNPGPFGPALGSSWGAPAGWGQPSGGVTETVVNNYYGSDPTNNDPGFSDPSGSASGSNDPNLVDTSGGQLDDQNLQDADYNDSGSDFDSGGDFGGGDDSSFT